MSFLSFPELHGLQEMNLRYLYGIITETLFAKGAICNIVIVGIDFSRCIGCECECILPPSASLSGDIGERVLVIHRLS
jgi:hypothetical protein